MRRWDDLQLLKFIDDHEESGDIGPLNNGLDLMKSMGGQDIDWTQDPRAFARELLLAQQCNYVEWRDLSMQQVGNRDPLANAQMWLQFIYEIRLTIPGRDRALGRSIQRPLPDPDEDDGRMISGITYEEIARALADEYTETQLPRFLRDYGIPDEFLIGQVEQGKVDYVTGVLEAVMEGGSAARRAGRAFIGGWLDGRFHAPAREDVRKRIVAILAQQGWHIREGRLTIGERTYDVAGVLTPIGRDARIAALHPLIRQVTDRLVQDGHFDAAILEAFKAVNNAVKKKANSALDGRSLMTAVFSDSDPSLVLGDLSIQSGRDIQEGFRFLFMGAVQGIRNPNAHEQFKDLSPEEGLEALAFASLLMRRLDSAEVRV